MRVQSFINVKNNNNNNRRVGLTWESSESIGNVIKGALCIYNSVLDSINFQYNRQL